MSAHVTNFWNVYQNNLKKNKRVVIKSSYVIAYLAELIHVSHKKQKQKFRQPVVVVSTKTFSLNCFTRNIKKTISQITCNFKAKKLYRIISSLC